MEKFKASVISYLKSDKAGPIVSICCGIITLVALYLPWVVVPLYDSYTLSLSGWRLIIWAESIGDTLAEPYLVMFGGVIMLVCGLPLLVRSVVVSRDIEIKKALVVGATVGAILAIIGVLWFLIRSVTSGESGSMGSGFFVCMFVALPGIIVSIRMTVATYRTAVVDRDKQWSRSISQLITLASGTVVLLGIFLPWLVQSGGGVTSSVSGWGLTRFDLTGASNPEPLLVMAGSILMIICGIVLASSDFLPITFLTSPSFARKFYWTSGFIVYISGALVIGGSLWFVISAVGDKGVDSIDFGVYILTVAALLGVIFGMKTCHLAYKRVILYTNGWGGDIMDVTTGGD